MVNMKNKNNVSLGKETEASRHIYIVSLPLAIIYPATKHRNAAIL